MTRAASFLIVDDDPLVRRTLGRVFQRYGECTTAASVNEAEQHLAAGGSWSGLVIDIWLGDGSGLDVLSHARRYHQHAPALVISGTLDRDVVNRAAAFNARFVCKPCGMRELAPFVSDVLARTSGDRVHAAIERARHHWNLTPREAEILDATLRGRPRSEYVKSACISVNTYKTHVHRLLEKVDYESLSSLAIDLLAQD